MSRPALIENLPKVLLRELKTCSDCRPVPGYMLLLCGWHENVVASTRVVQRIAAQERLL